MGFDFEAVFLGVRDDGLELGGVVFEEDGGAWIEMGGGLGEEFFDGGKAVVFGVEGDGWFVGEGFGVEPGPVWVDVGEVGGDEVELLIFEVFTEVG